MTSWTRGHRLVSHTADLILEAWGPDRESCIEEALCALTEVFADTRRAHVITRLPFSAHASTDPDLLVAALEEAIYMLDTLSVVPLRFRLTATDGDVGRDEPDKGMSEDRVVTGQAEVAAASDVELIGPVPKAVAYHGLEMSNREGTWRCRAVIDV